MTRFVRHAAADREGGGSCAFLGAERELSWVEQLAPTPPATAALAINYLLYSSQVTAGPWAHT